jgi:hypothetical protein
MTFTELTKVPRIRPIMLSHGKPVYVVHVSRTGEQVMHVYQEFGDRDWRRIKREVNKVFARARKARRAGGK